MPKTKKSQTKLFVTVFAVIVAVMVISTLTREKVISLPVANNAGCSLLETIDGRLAAVFQDGRTCTWDWGTLPQQQGDFKAVSSQAILLDAEHLAAVNEEGKKRLTVYSLPDGAKQKEMAVGWADQQVWLRISPDKKTTALIRRNAPDSKGSILYEFLTVDVETERTGPSASVSIGPDTEDFVDTAVANNGVLYAAGSQSDTGRIAAADLGTGSILWDRSFENTQEFCSVVVSPDSSIVYAGSRDGILYKINAATGEIIKRIQLLEPGETRPITNDYSVLNMAFSGGGKYFVVTINPKAYFLKADSDEIFYTCSPASRLVSKITFSPDNQSFATSDIRAGYPIKGWGLAAD